MSTTAKRTTRTPIARNAKHMENPPIHVAPPEQVVMVVDAMGQKIQGNLCGLYLTVRRPAGRPMMKEAKIEATTVEMDKATVKDEDTTRPCWKIDIHPLWKVVDLNKTKIDTVLAKYSVSAPMKGEHLVSLSKLGNCLVELNVLRNERLAIADEMKQKWDAEIIPGLQAKFPQFFENQIKDRLPSPDSLRDRFEVYWVIRPLTPMNNERLDFSALPESEAREVMKRNSEFIDQMYRSQVQGIFDEVFSEMLTLCNDINSGDYAFGKRRSGAITEILNMLDRINNFSDFASAEVLQGVTVARATMTKYSLQEINSSETVQMAIKTAMKPLGESLKTLLRSVSEGRSRRSVEV